MEKVKSVFRCPFEVRGAEAGTILDVQLGDEQEARIASYVEAIKALDVNHELVAVRFLLPKTFRIGKTLQGVRRRVLPYQAELSAAQIEVRLYPYLPYQPYKTGFEEARTNRKARELLAAAYSLTESIVPASEPDAKLISTAQVAAWLHERFAQAIKSGVTQNPSLVFFDRMKEFTLDLMQVLPGMVVIVSERDNASDRASNRNLFSIVRCSLYPPEFGRYSERMEIVITREADFVSVPMPIRKKIRTDANRALQSGRVKIINLEQDKQGGGLWIPTYR